MSTYTVISKNFMYLRAVFFGTHDNAVAQMKPWITRAQLSDYCLANKEPPFVKMRALEKHICLPCGWLERDIQALSKMSEDDFDLVQLLLEKPDNIKTAIKTIF